MNRLWTGNFILASCVNFIAAMMFYLLMTSMASYAIREFGAGQAVAGFASSSFILGAVFSRMLAGKYMDFVGRKTLALVSMIAFIVLGAAYIPVDNIVVLIVIRLLHGAAFGLNNTVLSAAVQTMIPQHRRAEGTGYFGMTVSLAMALGPFVSVVMSQKYGMFWVFAVCVVLSTLGTILTLFLQVEERTPSREEQLLKWKFHITSFIDPRALPIASMMALCGISFSLVLSFLEGYSHQIGAAAGASWFFIVMAACTFTSRLFVGRIQDTYGDNVVMYPIFVLMAVSYVMLATAQGSGMVIAAAVPLGLGFGSVMPCAQAIVINQSDASRYALAVATFFILLDTGTGLGPVLIGGLANVWGPRSMYWAAVVLVACAAVVYVITTRRPRRPE